MVWENYGVFLISFIKAARRSAAEIFKGGENVQFEKISSVYYYPQKKKCFN